MDGVADRLVVVATFLEPNQAHVARVRLDSEGILAALDSEHHIRANWLISNAIRGVKLLVHRRDLEAACRVLEESPAEITDADTGDTTDAATLTPRCPCCGSNDVYPERVWRKAFFTAYLFGLPLPFLSWRLLCGECGHLWEPDD